MRKSPSTISDRHKRRLVKAAVARTLLLSQNVTSDAPESKTETLSSHNQVAVVSLQESYLPTEEASSDKSPSLSCSTTDSEAEDINFDIRREIQLWHIKNKNTHASTTDLLKVLKRHPCFQNELPADSRTLLKTPRDTISRKVEPGNYVHFGLKGQLLKYLRNCEVSPESISVQINIDGLPISKSTNKQLWPILCCICETDYPVFPIGIYSGNQKPACVDDYLSEFIEEVGQLYNAGVEEGGVIVPFKISSFICDAPARAYITQIKGHSGFYACSKCTLKGDHIEKRLVFLESDAELRTNESFRRRVQPKHHIGLSPLEKLPLDLVVTIPLEYMHLVCLGVTRRLIHLWLKGKRKIFRLSQNDISSIDQKLLAIKKLTPQDFARKPRTIREFERWKAAELRQFLLYYGPIIMKKFLPETHYNLFLKLHLGIRILCSPKICISRNEEAEKYLRTFVKDYQEIYGSYQCTYNVHGLLHLPVDVLNHGCLDDFSAFKFENYLGKLKQKLRHSFQPLQQVYRRIIEEHECCVVKQPGVIQDKAVLLYPHCLHLYPRDLEVDTEYQSARLNNISLSVKEGNNFVLLKCGRVAKIINICKLINGDTVLLVKYFRNKRLYSHYKDECNTLQLYEITEDKNSALATILISEVAKKSYVIKISKSKFASIPVLHH